MEQSTYREADSSLAGQQIPRLLWNPKSRYSVHSSLPLALFVSPNYLCVISGFLREVDEVSALLGNYATYSGNSLPTFRDNISHFFKGPEILDRLSGNVDKELPLYAALYPRKAQFSR
jgi:hypothetical protein